jgi:membrane fusion protein (multidrug efflux system)
VAAYPDQVFEGRIDAINPKVEATTRNLLVRARLANPDEKLLPGMFANLQVLLAGETPQVLVPETAITYTLYGNSVYVIEEQAAEGDQPEQLQVQRRFVETGERRTGQVVILKGLQAGERVVSAGQLKLDNGARVTIVADPVETAE